MSELYWRFPSGARVKFAHLQFESNVYDWMGSQIALIGWDELTHFSRSQFFYLMTRNRSVSGVRPYMRATCNPDADSWVAKFIEWWIDEDTGYPIPERAGAVRWFARIGDELAWADNPDDLPRPPKPRGMTDDEYEVAFLPKSVTFIPAKLQDNRILMEADPSYLSNLLAQPLVERERLLDGNWKIRPAAGLMFKRHWFEIVDEAPADARAVRFWDLAATEEGKAKDPDYTAGVLLALKDGIYYLRDVRRVRESPQRVEALTKQTAELDGRHVTVGVEQEAGSSGVNTVDHYRRRVLLGFAVKGLKTTGNKAQRANPISAAAEAGNVKLVRGPWNEAFMAEAEQFPDGRHDDMIDALSGAHQLLTNGALPFGWKKVTGAA